MVVTGPRWPGLAIGLALACGGGEVADGTPKDRATDGPVVLTVTQERRIGSVDDPNEALTEPGGVLVTPDGGLIIAQPMSKTLLAFDDGAGVGRVIGRAGEGPGEFSEISAIGVLDDRVWVSGCGGARVTFFSWAGDLDSTVSWDPVSHVPDADGPRTFFACAPAEISDLSTGIADPMWMSSSFSTGLPFSSGVHVRPSSSRVPILRTDNARSVLDTIGFRTRRSSNLYLEHRGGMVRIRCPWDASPLVALLPEGRGLVAVDGRFAAGKGPHAFTLTLIALSADTVLQREVSSDPIPLDETAVRSVFEEVSRSRRETDPDAPDGDKIHEGFRGSACIPTSYPTVTDLVATQDGGVWLRRAETDGGDIPWDRFDPDTESTERVFLPNGQTIVAARGDRLVTLEHDEFDVPYLVKWRVGR